ncbi:MAG: divergent polysaccharide deacetylase family protein [Candidatus Aminicenantes bacterium]|nr:divergent polysaccharide deacetylase family protein [Candidatus Aminicenantes bacterium]
MKSGPSIKDRMQNSTGIRLYLILALLSLLSVLGLDYLAAHRGEKAYFFSAREPRAEPPSAARPFLAESVRLFLDASGLPPGSVRELQDEDGSPLFIVQLSAENYAGLEPLLEEALRDNQAVFDKDKKEIEGWTTYSWRIARDEKDRLALAFSFPRPTPSAEKKPREPVPAAPAERLVAIIIDDMGNSLETLKEICNLGQPITISVLPQSDYAEETARIAHENGLEVMLHLPGESLNHQEGNDSTPGLIRSGMSPEEIQALVEESIARVPHIQGVNNHMGSKITQEEAVMRPILETLKRRDLFFVDSRTTADSIAFDLAREMGLRCACRHIFLDASVGVDYSKRQMSGLIRLSQRTGRAVGIAHPFPETLQALRESLPLLAGHKVKPVFISEIIRRGN